MFDHSTRQQNLDVVSGPHSSPVEEEGRGGPLRFRDDIGEAFAPLSASASPCRPFPACACDWPCSRHCPQRGCESRRGLQAAPKRGRSAEGSNSEPPVKGGSEKQFPAEVRMRPPPSDRKRMPTFPPKPVSCWPHQCPTSRTTGTAPRSSASSTSFLELSPWAA